MSRSESLKKYYAEHPEKRIGINNSFFGHTHTKETKQKIRLSHIGKKLTLENKNKINKAMIKYQNEHPEMIKKRTENIKKYYIKNPDVVEKIRNRMISNNPFFGHKHTDEYKKKMSDIKIKFYEEHPEAIEKLRIDRLTRVYPSKDTSNEVALQNALMERGISFTKHKPITGQPDIFIEPNICVFSDGCYWHGCEQCFDKNKFNGQQRRGQIRDIFVTQKLINDGYVVLRFWVHETKKDLEGCILKIINPIGVEI